MKTAFILEDETNIRILESQILSENGFQVISANNGERAIKILDETRFDLIILDAVMPFPTGIDVLRYIKKGEINLETPVIMVSALSPSIDIMIEKKYKPSAYVSKPFTQKTFMETVKKIMPKMG
jgi:twitching motility two-component system response regulator PilH